MINEATDLQDVQDLTDDYYLNLSLPAKAMLLIALSLSDGFYLPSQRADRWYGISSVSADEGLRELRAAGLLHRQRKWLPAPRSKTGWTEHWTHTLAGRFSSDARRQAAAGSKRPRKDFIEDSPS
jgi:hypothetical protein